MGSVVLPRAGDCRVERLDRARRAKNESGARVNTENIRFGQCRLPRKANTDIVSKPFEVILLPTMTLAPVIRQCPTNKIMKNLHGRTVKVLTAASVDIMGLETSEEE